MKIINKPQYQMLIQWSSSDHCYVVSLPDFTELMQPCAHGKTYEDAAREGHKLIDSLVNWCAEEGKPQPVPTLYINE
jgi:antitoxin HicB